MNYPLDWYHLGKDHIWHPYTQMKKSLSALPVVSTQGSRITLADGRVLIDGIASWWSACHGYNHPVIQQAMHQQIDQMPHIMFAGLAHETAYALAYKLAELTKLERAFFSDSGSVAIEIAMKMSVQYFANQNKRQKQKFVSFKNSYHGDTMGAMSLSDRSKGIHSKFVSYSPQQYILSLPDSEDSLRQFEQFIMQNGSDIAGCVVEPLVQCAGGMLFHDVDTLAEMCKICQNNDVIFIVDEIATGFMRTGKFFAFQHCCIQPDIICLGKALTGGACSLAVTMASSKIFAGFLSDDIFDAFMHGPTYMANPVACSASLASLSVFEQENREQDVKNIENLFAQILPQFTELSIVIDTRYLGAIGVIEIKQNWDTIFQLRQLLLDRNIWLRPINNAVYLMPALNIEMDDLSYMLEQLRIVLNLLEEK